MFKSLSVLLSEAKGTPSWHKHAAEDQAADAEVHQRYIRMSTHGDITHLKDTHNDFQPVLGGSDIVNDETIT